MIHLERSWLCLREGKEPSLGRTLPRTISFDLLSSLARSVPELHFCHSSMRKGKK